MCSLLYKHTMIYKKHGSIYLLLLSSNYNKQVLIVKTLIKVTIQALHKILWVKMLGHVVIKTQVTILIGV